MENKEEIEIPQKPIKPDLKPMGERTLFLPVGSIRAIVMLTMLLSSIVFIQHGVIVPEWFNNLTIAAFAYYFGSKNGK
jgi:hypothetical protein